jgi:hypothetical protein
MAFGYFFNCCINASGGLDPKFDQWVKCRPHVDKKNIAGGVCGLFVYGGQSNLERGFSELILVNVRVFRPWRTMLVGMLGD